MKRYADTKVNPDYYGKVTIGATSNRRVPDFERNWLRSAWLRLAYWLDKATVGSKTLSAAGGRLSFAIQEAVNGGPGFILVSFERMGYSPGPRLYPPLTFTEPFGKPAAPMKPRRLRERWKPFDPEMLCHRPRIGEPTK